MANTKTKPTTITARVDRADLLNAVSRAALVVEKKATLPILTSVLLWGKGDTIHVVGTDTDFELTVSVYAEGADKLAACLNADKLIKVLKKTKQCDQIVITYNLGSDTIILDMEGVSQYLPVINPADWPVWDDGELEKYKVRLPQNAVAKQLKQVMHSTSFEETRYYLNGVSIKPYKGGLELCATDGHRLTVSRLHAIMYDSSMPQVILPNKAATTILKLIGKGDRLENIEGWFSGSRFQLIADDWNLRGKVIDATYPDYERVYPVEAKRKLTFDVATLLNAIESVCALTDMKRAVKIDYDGVQAAQLSVEDADGGVSSTVIPVTPELRGNRLVIGVNPKYLVEMVKSLDTDDVTIDFVDEGNPMKVYDIPNQQQTFCILMPMRT